MYRKMVCTGKMVCIEKINRLRNRITPDQRRLSFNPMKKLSDSLSFESCSQLTNLVVSLAKTSVSS